MALMTHRATSSTTVNTTCSSTSTNPATMPPPTVNQLDAAQRSRLIRSTRKLGKVLGTTPCVVESVPPLPTLSPSASVADMAKKRYSVPPAPKSTFGDFTTTTDFDSSEGRSHKTSIASDEGSDSAEASTTSFVQHRKASSDALGPLPMFPDSKPGRRKPKRLQPMLRLPPTTTGNAQLLTLPSESPTTLFSPDYRLDAAGHVDPATKPLPLSPTSSISPSSTEMPPTPPSKLLDKTDNSSITLPDDVYEYPGSIKIRSLEADESRLRKRRMEKLMRHLGECVPSELVFGSSRRDAMSFSGALPSTGNGGLGTRPEKMKDVQSRVMRRISVISGQRKRTYAEESDPTSPGCFSDPEPGTPTRIHAVLMRERSKIHIARNEGRAKEKPLVEDDWTPEAYEDVVKRLRQLK